VGLRDVLPIEMHGQLSASRKREPPYGAANPNLLLRGNCFKQGKGFNNPCFFGSASRF
jgi:hypothetical protein